MSTIKSNNEDLNLNADGVGNVVNFQENGVTQFTSSEVANSVAQVTNVMDYGATGDGVADDSTAVNNAITNATGVVYFPAGTYNMNSTVITVKSNITLLGDGSGKSVIEAAGINTLATYNNVTVKDLSFTEHAHQFRFQSSTNIRFHGVIFEGENSTGNRPLAFYDCEEIYIESCKFKTFQYAINLGAHASGPNRHVVISACVFEGTLSESYPAAINIVEGQFITIEGSTFRDIAASNSGYAIYEGDRVNNDCNDIVVSNCVIDNCDIGIDFHGAGNIAIQGCTINDTHPAIRTLGNGGVITPSLIQTNISIIGNVITGGDIRPSVTSGGTGCRNIAILGNTITNDQGYGVYAVGDSGGNLVEDISITGNTIRECLHSGIACKDSARVSVTGNTITDCNTGNTAAGTGDRVAGIAFLTTNYTTTIGNTIINTPGGNGRMKYGISFGSGMSSHNNHVYWHNTIISPDQPPYRGAYVSAPAAGTWTIGQEVMIFNAAGAEAPGVRCVDSGTFGSFSVATGATDGSTAVITGLGDTTGLEVRDYVSVSAGFASTGPYCVVAKTSTTITLDYDSNSVQTGVTVAHVSPVFKDMADLAT